MRNLDFKILKSGLSQVVEMKDIIVLISECEHYSWANETLLLASKSNNKWKFEAWDRDIEDNIGWYSARFYETTKDKIVRYTDSCKQNSNLSNWANSREITYDEEVGRMLWANFYVLIKGLKKYINDDKFYVIDYYVQLYKQLENIRQLGFEGMRNKYEFPHEEHWFFDLDDIRLKAENLCAMLEEEDEADRGFKHVEFMEFVARPYRRGRKHYEYTNADGSKIN